MFSSISTRPLIAWVECLLGTPVQMTFDGRPFRLYYISLNQQETVGAGGRAYCEATVGSFKFPVIQASNAGRDPDTLGIYPEYHREMKLCIDFPVGTVFDFLPASGTDEALFFMAYDYTDV